MLSPYARPPLPRDLIPLAFLTSTLYASRPSPACHIPRQFHPSWFDRHSEVWWLVQIMTSHCAVFSGCLVLPPTWIQMFSSALERLRSLLWICLSLKICSYVTYVLCDLCVISTNIFLSYLRLCLLKSAKWPATAWMTAGSIQAGALNSFPLPMCSERP